MLAAAALAQPNATRMLLYMLLVLHACFGHNQYRQKVRQSSVAGV
jgi:hypothetical protein